MSLINNFNNFWMEDVMKKLVVLMLVLGLVSVTNAGLTLSLSGNTVAKGGALTIGVNGDGATPITSNSQDLWIVLNGVAANISGGTIAYAPGSTLTGIATYTVGDGSDVVEGFTQAMGFNGTSTIDATLIDSTIPNRALNGSLVTGVNFLAGQTQGTVTVSLMSADLGTLYNSQTVTVTPEPITMALLGLGGLFIRRRVA